jgi:hypothetical protein
LRIVFGNRSDLLLSGDYGRFEGVPLTYAKPLVAKPGFAFDNPTNLWTVRTSHLTSGKNIQQGALGKAGRAIERRDDAEQPDRVPKIQLASSSTRRHRAGAADLRRS